MSDEDNKQLVARFVEVCQNQHDLQFADEVFHPDFVNHYEPEGRRSTSTARCRSVNEAKAVAMSWRSTTPSSGPT
jgi:hypothetical protein